MRCCNAQLCNWMQACTWCELWRTCVGCCLFCAGKDGTKRQLAVMSDVGLRTPCAVPRFRSALGCRQQALVKCGVCVNVCCTLQVNEAVNDLLIDEEDFEGLKSSIASFDNFDQVGTACCACSCVKSMGLRCLQSIVISSKHPDTGWSRVPPTADPICPTWNEKVLLCCAVPR
jgi:hypothetical protein